MSNQITTAFAQQYSSNVELQFQQMGSRLRQCVTLDQMGAEYKYFDRVGTVDAQKKTSRHADVTYTDTPHSRRRVTFEDFFHADMIDKEDKLRMLADPTSEYVRTAVAAMGREMDKIILNAAFGTAYSGKTGATSVSLPSTQQIAVNYVETGSPTNSALTIGKLRAGLEQLESEESIADGEELFCIYNSFQKQSLLQTTEVTSSDFNTVKALTNGQLDTFLGMKFIRTQLVLKDSNGYDRVLIMPKSAIKLAIPMDITSRIDQIPHKFHNYQVLVEMSAGATRMWEEKVVEVKCLAS